MKNKERIAILESEISRLKVANRNNIYRIEAIESHLAEQHKGASFNPEAPECVANNGVSSEPIKPDFIPDWKDAPEDAVCVAMDKYGTWYWYGSKPSGVVGSVFVGVPAIKIAGNATNAHLLPFDYWKSTLMMRPEPISEAPDYSHLLPDGYEFCSEEDAEKWVKVKSLHFKGELPIGYIDPNITTLIKPYYRPIRKIKTDYSHLLPDGYEFCSEEGATYGG